MALEMFGNSVSTFAIGGDRTEDLAWRLFKGGGATALSGCKPTTVVLLIGTNDYGSGQLAASAGEELLLLIKELRRALPSNSTLVLHALLPRATRSLGEGGAALPWGPSAGAYEYIQHLNGIMRSFAEQESSGYLTFVDCADVLLRDGQIVESIFHDFLHLSAEGYEAWSLCLRQHLGNVGWRSSSKQQQMLPQTGVVLNAESGIVLVPQKAQVKPTKGHPEPIEVLWQRPSGSVRAVVLLLHGCAHQGTDWWPREHCAHCLGLPEEIRILRRVLSRGYMAVAVTSIDRESGCWTLPDLDRVEEALAHVYNSEGLASAFPLFAFGASSGGAFVGKLADTAVVGRTLLRCRIPQIMATPGTPRFSTTFQNGEHDSWPAPPTLFIHMPVDSRTAHRVSTSLDELWAGSVTAAELKCVPLPITDTFFSSRIDGISDRQSQKLANVLRDNGFLDEQGYLREDPRGFFDWRDALWSTGVPEELDDSLEPDGSKLNEEMNLAWAAHEMCATFVEEMLDFCEKPQATCAKHGWACSKPK